MENKDTPRYRKPKHGLTTQLQKMDKDAENKWITFFNEQIYKDKTVFVYHQNKKKKKAG